MADGTQNANPSYAELRGMLVQRGYSVASWARSRGHRASTVYDAIKGLRHGVKATQIRRQLVRFLHA